MTNNIATTIAKLTAIGRNMQLLADQLKWHHDSSRGAAERATLHRLALVLFESGTAIANDHYLRTVAPSDST